MGRSLVRYGILALVWLLLCTWQGLEHRRMSEMARRGLSGRVNDLAAAFSVLVRSQGRVSMVPRERLEAALQDLVSSTDLLNVTLLSSSGEIAASAGAALPVDKDEVLREREVWQYDSASFANLVALGPGADEAALLPMDMPPVGGPPREPRFGGPRPGENGRQGGPEHRGRGGSGPGRGREGLPDAAEPNDFEPVPPEERGESLPPESLDFLSGPGELRPPFPGGHRGPMQGPPPGRPPWMGSEEYDNLIQERGVHWLLVSLPLKPLHAAVARDLQLRLGIALAALLAALGLGAAWHALERSADLGVQLARSREKAERLEELNLTAAGLVHETKNPLNLVRGMAQLVGRNPDLPGDVRGTATKITEEADRITGRLNQFLEYARPLQPHLKPVSLDGLVRNIFEVLACDREEKSVDFRRNGPPLHVLADENLTRQVLFNLIHNAVQAVPSGGMVEVCWGVSKQQTVTLEVRDNGPGVPESIRNEIFRPYFTASEKGTGLGLAIVRQIAAAHGWAVRCVPSSVGARFRVENIAVSEEQAHEQ